ncbi:MAG: hypothetical protein ACPGE9_06130, partial [Algiphilus sp.]
MTGNASLDPCHEPQTQALVLDEARARILSAVAPVGETERVALADACQRVLAEAVAARADVPAHTNSAMDGYALRAVDAATPGTRLRPVGESFAGHPFAGTVGAGECVRIMTGAVLPDGADSVVMQERATVHEDGVAFDKAPAEGDNVRPAGEDIARGATVLARLRWPLFWWEAWPWERGAWPPMGSKHSRARRAWPDEMTPPEAYVAFDIASLALPS